MSNKFQDSNNRILNNIVYIHDIFDDSVAFNILPWLDTEIKKQGELKSGKIIFDIRSDGGCTTILKELLARIEKAKCANIIIETRALSKAYSCGSMLACSGTKEHRYIGQHTNHLCHLGHVGSRYVINDTELERVSGFAQEHFNFVRDNYKKYANIPNLKKVIHSDQLYVSGQKIIDWGLADKFYEES